ncbi:YadA C-terminal domain-containing protein [Rahnella sp. PCH160]|uniref:YadA C-terminal domain-containing protein n=1 Tax=Rahnella sp. PCH160 TaxID=3447928 RepID=UPI0039FD120F
MKAQATDRNTQIINAYIAGNHNKSELARYFGVSASTIRRVLAGVVLAATSMGNIQTAEAKLSPEDLATVNAFVAAHPEFPEWIKDNLTADYQTNLDGVNRVLATAGGSAWSENAKGNVPIPQSIPTSVKLVVTLTPHPVTTDSENNDPNEPSVLQPETFAGKQKEQGERNLTALKYAAVVPQQTFAGKQKEQGERNLTAMKYAAVTSQETIEGQENEQAQRDLTAQKYAAVVPQQTFAGKQKEQGERNLTALKYAAVVPQQTFAGKQKEQGERNLTALKYAAVTSQETIEGQKNEQAQRDLTAQKYAAVVPQETAKGQQKEKDERILTQQKHSKSIVLQTVTQATGTPIQQPVIQQQVRSAYYDKQITALNAEAEQHHAEVLTESHARYQADKQVLSESESYTNQKFSDLKSQVDDNKKEAAAGSASAMAQANIPQVQESQQFAVGAGIGGYDSENALSVGASFHAGQATIVKMSVSDDSQDNVGYGAGVSIGW